MFNFSNVNFDEISMKYFYLEYYAYEKFIKSEIKPTDLDGNELDVKITKVKGKKPPLLKAQSSEYFDLTQSKRPISINKYDNIQRVSETSDKILGMGWVYFIEESFSKILYALIDRKIIKYEKYTSKPILKDIYEWFQNIVLKFCSIQTMCKSALCQCGRESKLFLLKLYRV